MESVAHRERQRERDLGRETLAVAAPRGVEVDEDEVEGRDGRIEVRFVQFQYLSIRWQRLLSTSRRWQPYGWHQQTQEHRQDAIRHPILRRRRSEESDVSFPFVYWFVVNLGPFCFSVALLSRASLQSREVVCQIRVPLNIFFLNFFFGYCINICMPYFWILFKTYCRVIFL